MHDQTFDVIFSIICLMCVFITSHKSAVLQYKTVYFRIFSAFSGDIEEVE